MGNTKDKDALQPGYEDFIPQRSMERKEGKKGKEHESKAYPLTRNYCENNSLRVISRNF